MAEPNNQGIQQLLRAETKASEIIAQARQRKIARLKQAQEEADREIAEFKAQKESEYRAELMLQTGSLEEESTRLQQQTNESVGVIRQAAELKGEEVIRMWLKTVINVQTE